MDHEPRDPDFENKVRDSFARQRVMSLIGARLASVAPGRVTIELPFREDLTQQHGFVHAGVTTTIADSAGGYSAYSLMPPESAILTVEFKVNLLAPAEGERFVATGRCVKPGKRLFVCEIEVHAVRGERSRLCLFGLQTNMLLPAGPDGPPPG